MSLTALTVGVLIGKGALAAPPPILLTPARVQAMKSMKSQDPDFRDLIAFLDKQYRARSLETDNRGAANLAAARRIHWEILIGSVLWKVNDDASAHDRALAAIRSGAKLPAYKDDEYGPISELMTGLSIGYSLFYDELSAAERTDITDKIAERGIRWAQKQKNSRAYWTTKNDSSPGSTYAALQLATTVLPPANSDAKNARALVKAHLPTFLNDYKQVGGTAEGVMYWNYIAYTSLLSDTAAGDAGLDTAGSMIAKLNPSFPTYAYGPSQQAFNFGDSFEGALPAPISFRSSQAGDHYWYRKHIADGVRANGRAWFWPEFRYLALAAILWDRTGTSSDLAAMPLDKVFTGSDTVGTFRSAWNDPNSVYAAYRGGSTAGVHGQLDLGSFVYEAEGVRWIVDLGQDAPKDDYFNLTPGGRWGWLRTSSESHSVLLTKNGGSKPNRSAPSVEFSDGGSSPFGVLNLASAYGLLDYTRAYQLQNRRALQIKDQLGDGLSGGGTWQAITRAQVTTNGSKATLRQSGKTATIEVIEPAGARINAEQLASSKKVNATIAGVTAVSFDVPSGTKRVIVRISPN